MGAHRRHRQHKIVAAASTAGFAGTLALAAATPGNAASVSTWDKVAACESSGNWQETAGEYEGGLQFLNSTWLAYGGGKYAPHAYQATKAQQIIIAEKVLAGQGPGAWPTCSVKAGLTRGGPAPFPAAPSVPQTAPRTVTPPSSSKVAITAGARAVSYAKSMIGTPYRYGGNGRGGIDCSGLTSQAWAHAGVKISRVANDQWHKLPRVSMSDLKPGDLVAFGYRSGYADHIGIYAGKGMLIDTASKYGGGVGIGKLSARAGGGSWHALGAVRPAGKTLYKSVPKWAKPEAEKITPKTSPEVLPPSAQVEQDGVITHTVVPGDTLWHIARLYDVKDGWPAIFRANIDVIEQYAEEHGAAADGNWIYPGQVIKIPGARKV